MRFLDVKTDYAFKRVFGAEGSKPLLIGFLSAILECEGAGPRGPHRKEPPWTTTRTSRT